MYLFIPEKSALTEDDVLKNRSKLVVMLYYSELNICRDWLNYYYKGGQSPSSAILRTLWNAV